MISENTKIILASQSPRRKEILEKANFTFDIMPSDFEMDINNKKYSDDLLKKCVIGKTSNITKSKTFIERYKDFNDLLIISADTVVVLDNIIIGKPKDEKNAHEILKKLSGNTHFVATGINITSIKNKKVASYVGIEKTYVTFRQLSNQEITEYIKKAKPFDKAGSYGIQDPSFTFVTKITGNLDNVIGFPMKLFNHLIILLLIYLL